MNKINYALSLGGWTRLWVVISLTGFIIICAYAFSNAAPEWSDFYGLKFVIESRTRSANDPFAGLAGPGIDPITGDCFVPEDKKLKIGTVSVATHLPQGMSPLPDGYVLDKLNCRNADFLASSDLFHEAEFRSFRSNLWAVGPWLVFISTLFITGHALRWIYRGFKPKESTVPPAQSQ